MFAVAPPPVFAQQVSSDDPDEVTSWAARRDGYHSRVVHGTGPYGFRAALLEGRNVQLAWARTRLGHTLRGRFRQACVHVPLDANQQYAFGRERIGVAPGSLTFIAPGTETSRHSGAGSVLAVDVDAAALVAEVQARRPAASQLPLSQVPQALEPCGPLQSDFSRAIAALALAHGPGAPANQRAHCESRVIAVLADALAFRSESDAAGRMAARRVAELEAWIDAHLADPITMGKLCAVSQVGARTLQLAFQARRGMSPMRFVCERRLAAAHRRIAHAGIGEDITGIATSLGFTHLGRFSQAYRDAFGESPSRTWQRNRRPGAPGLREPGLTGSADLARA